MHFWKKSLSYIKIPISTDEPPISFALFSSKKMEKIRSHFFSHGTFFFNHCEHFVELLHKENLLSFFLVWEKETVVDTHSFAIYPNTYLFHLIQPMQTSKFDIRFRFDSSFHSISKSLFIIIFKFCIKILNICFED